MQVVLIWITKAVEAKFYFAKFFIWFSNVTAVLKQSVSKWESRDVQNATMD